MLSQILQDFMGAIQRSPRLLLFAIPVPIFLVTVVVTLATSGGDDNGADLAVVPTMTPSLLNIDEPPTATPTPRPTSTPAPPPPAPNREDCAEIQGTEYLSPEEREWYLSNCLGGATADTGGGGGGGGSSNVTTPSGPAAVGAGEYSLGHRMMIPTLGIDAPVNGVAVPSNGAMPDPVGYFNFVWYDFSSFGGLGGTAGNGNYVVGCHVDSAVHGIAICYYVRNLGPGATIQLVTEDGTVRNYTVTSSTTYSANTDFSGIVSSGAADLTIITCTGTFAGGGYDQRHVVQARLS